VGRRVLVVDDNETNRRILSHQLQRWGLVPEFATDGAGALELLRAAVAADTPYDLAVLDFQMPEMDGFMLAEEIRRDPRLAGIPMIMLTSYGLKDHRQRADALGFAACYTKPVRESLLRGAIVDVLTASQRAAAPSPKPGGSADAGAEAAPLRGRILIAEDNAVNQKVSRRQVEKLGYRVDIAANGLEVLEALARIRYDAVLMDCQMPEMDGYEATTAIRALEERGALAHLPIIAMTANALEGERDSCLEAGMDDYVSKPVNIQALRVALAKWAPRREMPETDTIMA